MKTHSLILQGVLFGLFGLVGCTAKSPNKPIVEDYTERGKQLAKEGKITASVVSFNRGISLEPTNPAPYIGLAVLYESLNRSDLAVETLEQLQAVSPTAKGLSCRLAEAYLGAEDLTSARAWSEKAAKEGEDMVRTHSVYGIVMLRFRYWDTALEQLTQAWKLAPDDKELPLLIMDVHLQKGDYDKATQLGETLLTQFETSPQLQYKLGWGYARQPLKQDVAKKAERHLRRAFELSPQWFEPYAELGRLYKSLARNEDALHSFEQAWKLNKAVPGVMFNLSVLWRQKGDKRAIEVETAFHNRMKEQEKFTALRRDYNSPLSKDFESNVIDLARREGKSQMYGTALHRLRKLLSKNPENVEALKLYVLYDQQARSGYESYLRPGPGISAPGF